MIVVVTVIAQIGFGMTSVLVTHAFMIAMRGARAAMVDLTAGVDNAHDFQASLKADGIQYHLTSICNYRGIIGPRSYTPTPQKPSLVCVPPATGATYQYLELSYDLWQRCTNSPPLSAPQQAFYADGTAYIYLCPCFHWQHIAHSIRHCPLVVHIRRAGDPNLFYRSYHMYTILYELIRFYFGTYVFPILHEIR